MKNKELIEAINKYGRNAVWLWLTPYVAASVNSELLVIPAWWIKLA